MSLLSTNFLTLADQLKRQDPDSKEARIIEIMAKTNEVLDDMMVMPGNLPTGHRTTIRTGYPQGTWRKLYGGVKQEKSKTRQVEDTCGMLESYGEADEDLVNLAPSPATFRMSESRAFIQGLGETMASTLFYGDTAANPERFMGLTPRFDDETAENAAQLIDAGGDSDGDNTSIWLVGWGDEGVSGIVPRGSMTGLQHNDMGVILLDAPDGNGKYRAYVDHYKWDLGLTLKNWKYVVRIHSIDVATATADPTAATYNLIDKMTQALEQMWNLTAIKPVFYMNRGMRGLLRRQIVNKVAASTLTMDQVAGKKVMMFGEVPVRRVDAILNTENRPAT